MVYKICKGYTIESNEEAKNVITVIRANGTTERVEGFPEGLAYGLGTGDAYALVGKWLNGRGYVFVGEKAAAETAKKTVSLTPNASTTKVTLTPSPKMNDNGEGDYELFTLTWKVNGKPIIKLDETGFTAAEPSSRWPAVKFTKNDIAMLENLDDFEVASFVEHRKKRPVDYLTSKHTKTKRKAGAGA